MSNSAFFNINNNQGDVFTLTTQLDSGTTFDSNVSAFSGKIPRIDYGDGFAEAGTSLSHTYSDSGSSKTVKLSIDRLSNITLLQFPDNSIVGDIDLSKMVNCSNFQFSLNPGLTGVTFPTTTANVNSLNFFLCNINGAIDLTTMPNIQGTVFLSNNPNLTGLTIPSASTKSFTDFRVNSCNISGRLDFSGYTGGFGGFLGFGFNPNLTGLTFPSNSTNIIFFNASSTGIVGELDISGLGGFGGTIQIDNNPNLSSIVFPPSSNSLSSINLGLNNLVYGYDLTPLSGLGGSVIIQNHANLTGLTFPSVSNIISSMGMSSNLGFSSVDFSPLSGMSGNLFLSSCQDLNSIIFPTVVSGVFSKIYFDDCKLSTYVNLTTISGITHNNIDIRANSNFIPTAGVNQMLYDLDNMGWTGGTFWIQGGTNGAPDGFSGGYDGTGATANLLTKGWSLSTN